MKTNELDWLVANKGVLKISRIAKIAGVPERTLNNFVNDNRPLPDKWREKVINWVKEHKK